MEDPSAENFEKFVDLVTGKTGRRQLSVEEMSHEVNLMLDYYRKEHAMCELMALTSPEYRFRCFSLAIHHSVLSKARGKIKAEQWLQQERRQLLQFLEKAAQDTGSFVENTANDVGGVVEEGLVAAGNWLEDAWNSIKDEVSSTKII